MAYPEAFNHTGLPVPGVNAAFKWYTEVLGFYPTMKPTTITRDNSAVYRPIATERPRRFLKTATLSLSGELLIWRTRPHLVRVSHSLDTMHAGEDSSVHRHPGLERDA